MEDRAATGSTGGKKILQKVISHAKIFRRSPRLFWILLLDKLRRCTRRTLPAGTFEVKFGPVSLELDSRDGRDHSGSPDIGGRSTDLISQREYFLALYRCSYEPLTRYAIGRFLRRGGIFFDVGANVGFFSAFAASIVGPEGEVHSFDLDPRCMRSLEALRDRNPRYGIHPVHAAVGEKVDAIEYEMFENCSWNSLRENPGCRRTGQAVKVRMTTLSDYISSLGIRPPDLIKIDVEGYEYAVLAGFRTYLQMTGARPPMIVETGPQSDHFGEIPKLIGDLGYAMHDLMPPHAFLSLDSLVNFDNILLLPRASARG
jgi:FkbM family methyltransferase